MEVIPLSPIPAQTFQVVLDDQNCKISLYQKGLRMYLDLYKDEILLSAGNICQNTASIVQGALPQFTGTLHFFDRLGVNPPEYHLLNDRYILLYIPAGEEIPAELQY